MATRKERRRERLRMVERFRSSGMTLHAFAEKEGVSRETVRRWSRIAAEARIADPVGDEGGFVEVSVPSAATAPPAMIEIQLRGGALVRVPTTLSSNELTMIFGAISSC